MNDRSEVIALKSEQYKSTVNAKEYYKKLVAEHTQANPIELDDDDEAVLAPKVKTVVAAFSKYAIEQPARSPVVEHPSTKVVATASSGR